MSYLIQLSGPEEESYNNTYHDAGFKKSLEELHIACRDMQNAWAGMEPATRRLFFAVEWDDAGKTLFGQDIAVALAKDIERFEYYFDVKQTRRKKRLEFELIHLALSDWQKQTGLKPSTNVSFTKQDGYIRGGPAFDYVEKVKNKLKTHIQSSKEDIPQNIIKAVTHLNVTSMTEAVIKADFVGPKRKKRTTQG